MTKDKLIDAILTAQDEYLALVKVGETNLNAALWKIAHAWRDYNIYLLTRTRE